MLKCAWACGKAEVLSLQVMAAERPFHVPSWLMRQLMQ